MVVSFFECLIVSSCVCEIVVGVGACLCMGLIGRVGVCALVCMGLICLSVCVIVRLFARVLA